MKGLSANAATTYGDGAADGDDDFDEKATCLESLIDGPCSSVMYQTIRMTEHTIASCRTTARQRVPGKTVNNKTHTDENTFLLRMSDSGGVYSCGPKVLF